MPAVVASTPAAPAFPPLYRRHVRRPRLTRLLDQSTAQVIVLNAPAGYGKTTLAAEWLQGKKNVAWYRATAASADPAALALALALKLGPRFDKAAKRIHERLRAEGAAQPSVAMLADLLAPGLAEWPPEDWLVIDDYHLVADAAPGEDLVEELILRTSVRLLLTTRRQPRWLSARRTLYGQAFELGREHLAMTNDEALRVLSAVRRSPSPRFLTAAHGWPALIGLAALTEATELPGEGLSETVYRYLAEEVWRQEAVEIREFMVLASVLPAVDTVVLRDFIGPVRAEPLLDRLHRDGILERVGEEFRFHPLLRDFLRKKAARDWPDLAQAVQSSAIRRARLLSKWDEAFEIATESGDRDLAAWIAGDAASDLLAAGRVATLRKWLDLCGAAVFDVPIAQLARAELKTISGDLGEAGAIAREVAARLPPNHPALSRAWFLAGQAAHLSSAYDTALALHLRAARAASTPRDHTNANWGAFLSAWSRGADHLDHFIERCETLGSRDIDSRLRIAAARQLAAGRRGSYAGVWELWQPLLDQIQFALDPMARTNALITISWLNTSRAEYDLAATYASAAYAACTELGLDFALGFCVAARGAAEIGLRDYRRATRTVRELGRLADNHEDPHLKLEHATVATKLAIVRREPLEPIFALTSRGGRLPELPLGQHLAVRALFEAVLGEPASARNLAKQAKATSPDIDTRFGAAVAEAVSSYRTNATSRTLAQLRLIALEADAADCRDPLTIACGGCATTFTALHEDSTTRRLAARVHPSRAEAPLNRAGPHASLVTTQPLTPRESEVLALLLEGATNRELARHLVISIATAKVHVHNVLRKLGARSRVELLVRERGGAADT